MPTQITAENGTTVKYTYFADGTKFKAVNATGNGFAYTGSLRWSVQDGILTPESVAITGGRALYDDIDESWSANYYICDHLGSVRVVTDAEGNKLDTYDYMPYGRELIANTDNTTDYRFTGKEKQTAFGESNIYDSFARFQNTYGRFMSIDPKAESFYHISPYTYCAGDPVNLVDPDGEIIKVVADGEIHYWREYNGVWGFCSRTDKIYAGTNNFVNAVSGALMQIGQSLSGFQLIKYLSNHEKEIMLYNTSRSGYLNGKLGWNINSPEAVPTTEGLQSNAIVNLAHELAHAKYEFDEMPEGVWFEYIKKNGEIGTVNKSEIYTTHYENKIRSEMGLPLRTHYAIFPEGCDNPSQIIDPITRKCLYYNIFY
ncbi:MAG: hypothetical protein E7140_06045 [Rikenellaceae bacterium]|nr:hypothetical protein [Rikenellaceae bacterium]